MLTDKAKYLQMIVDGRDLVLEGQGKMFHGVSGYLEIEPDCPRQGRAWLRWVVDAAQKLDVWKYHNAPAFDAVADACAEEWEIWGCEEVSNG